MLHALLHDVAPGRRVVHLPERAPDGRRADVCCVGEGVEAERWIGQVLVQMRFDASDDEIGIVGRADPRLRTGNGLRAGNRPRTSDRMRTAPGSSTDASAPPHRSTIRRSSPGTRWLRSRPPPEDLRGVALGHESKEGMPPEATVVSKT